MVDDVAFEDTYILQLHLAVSKNIYMKNYSLTLAALVCVCH